MHTSDKYLTLRLFFSTKERAVPHSGAPCRACRLKQPECRIEQAYICGAGTCRKRSSTRFLREWGRLQRRSTPSHPRLYNRRHSLHLWVPLGGHPTLDPPMQGPIQKRIWGQRLTPIWGLRRLESSRHRTRPRNRGREERRLAPARSLRSLKI